MRTFLALLLLATSAHAETIVFQEPGQVIVLVDTGRRMPMASIWREAAQRGPGTLKTIQILEPDAIASDVRFFMFRTRIIDGALTCEKFAKLPPDPDSHAEIVALLRDKPCSF